jgi:hypothetical protein
MPGRFYWWQRGACSTGESATMIAQGAVKATVTAERGLLKRQWHSRGEDGWLPAP